MRLASWENLEENLRSVCVLSASSARSARRLSLPALSAHSSLSRYSLTSAKRENGTKRAFEDRKPFLRLKLEKSSINSDKIRLREHNRGAKQSKKAKNLIFQEDLRFRSNF